MKNWENAIVPDWYEWTNETKQAYNKVMNEKGVFFITGSAGTSKSTTLKVIISNLPIGSYVVLAPTGVAASNLRTDGIVCETIHSFFSFPPKPMFSCNIPKPVRDLEKYIAPDTIIIDEISMVSSLMLSAIDEFYRRTFGIEEFFGGKRLIVVGDLYQLPPVISDKSEMDYIKHTYKSKYFYSAKPFEFIPITTINFTKIFRQKDEKFISFLNSIKYGTITRSQLNEYNQIMLNNEVKDDALILCTYNRDVEHYNSKKLDEINSKPIILVGKVEGNFNIKQCAVEEVITVKIGARVMIRANDKVEGKYINGSVGTLLDFNGSVLTIELDNKEIVYIEKVEFNSEKYEFDQKSKEIISIGVGKFIQYPISVGYAMSIHKSQSCTIDEYVIDTGERGVFDSGQTYVSLSRCTKLSGIKLKRPLSISEIIVDNEIVEFMSNINNGDIKEYVKEDDGFGGIFSNINRQF